MDSDKEDLVYSEYLHEEEKPSQYIPGKMVIDNSKTYLACPACGEHHRDLEHHERICCSCGLNLERRANRLIIWRSAPRAVTGKTIRLTKKHP